MNIHLPERIVCLTEETTETLYLLGEDDRIVGVSGYTMRPPQARKEKPKVSAFTSAKIDKILDLKPELVLGFSDMQADIAAELIRNGVAVLVFNQRSIDNILNMILLLGTMVGVAEKAQALVADYQDKIKTIKQASEKLQIKPKVYFEEWNDPLISGIGWVSELVEIAGGIDCFSELARHAGAKDRIIADPLEVVQRQPDIIIGSWCGRKFRQESVAERPDWQIIPAVRTGHLYEIKSVDILQPGPAALTDGLEQLHQIVKKWAAEQ